MPNDAHLHLLVNHASTFATLIGAALLVAGLAWRQAAVTRAALGLLVAAGVAAWVANWTGEGAEEAVEHLAGVSRQALHAHEAAAETAMWTSLALAALALAALVATRTRPSVPAPLALGLFALALVSTGVTANAANLGGLIRHPEIRDGAAPGAPRGAARTREHDDDD